MPQINDYSTLETQAQGPVGGISPNLEAAGAVGRAIENVGGQISEAGDKIHRREVQAGITDVIAAVADKRNDLTQEVISNAGKPDFDIDEFKNRIDEWSDAQKNNLTTPEATNAFERQAARLKATLTSKAIVLQAVAAGNEAKQNMQKGLNKAVATLEIDPSQFHDLLSSSVENVGSVVEANHKLDPIRPQLEAHQADQLAMGALRGLIKQDPGSEEKGQVGAAQKALDSGVFNDYLTPESRKSIEQQIKMGQHGADVDKLRQEKAVKSINDQAVEDWKQSNVSRLVDHSLSVADVMNATMVLPDGSKVPVPFDEKKAMIHTMDMFTKKAFDSNPAVKSDVSRRIHLPASDPRAITDPQQVFPMIKEGSLSPTDGAQFMAMASKRPEAVEAKKLRAKLLSAAESQIRYKEMADPVSGQAPYATLGDTKNGQFIDDLTKAENAQRAANKPVADLYDAKSPDSFWHKIESYKSSPQERRQAAAADKLVMAQKDIEARKKRLPNETIEAYDARMKTGK